MCNVNDVSYCTNVCYMMPACHSMHLTSPNRTGSRSYAGMLRDGYNSAIRYFYNNFYDGFRQVRIALTAFPIAPHFSIMPTLLGED